MSSLYLGARVRVVGNEYSQTYSKVIGRTGTVKDVSPGIIDVHLDNDPEGSTHDWLFEPSSLELIDKQVN